MTQSLPYQPCLPNTTLPPPNPISHHPPLAMLALPLLISLIIHACPTSAFTGSSRREAIAALGRNIAGTFAAGGLASASSFTTGVEPASARDELFKPNPLTNPMLEQIRIWEQDSADNIKYGGELAPGSPKGREAYAKLLVPILGIQRDLDAVNEMVHQDDKTAALSNADDILSKPQFQKIAFKKTFNAFADNIYYSDPDRANAYLGGGAVPKNEQSIAYLLRNDILTNVESLQAEVKYLIKEQKKISSGEETGPLETDDLYEYAKTASVSMKKYLDLVPPAELELGKKYFASN